jgi:DNA-binding GntR family transcriptional regulator
MTLSSGTAVDHATPSHGVPVFEPITRETLSAQIRDQLLERILNGTLEPGSRVPSERSLSEQFGWPARRFAKRCRG